MERRLGAVSRSFPGSSFGSSSCRTRRRPMKLRRPMDLRVSPRGSNVSRDLGLGPHAPNTCGAASRGIGVDEPELGFAAKPGPGPVSRVSNDERWWPYHATLEASAWIVGGSQNHGPPIPVETIEGHGSSVGRPRQLPQRGLSSRAVRQVPQSCRSHAGVVGEPGRRRRAEREVCGTDTGRRLPPYQEFRRSPILILCVGGFRHVLG